MTEYRLRIDTERYLPSKEVQVVLTPVDKKGQPVAFIIPADLYRGIVKLCLNK